MRKNLFTLLLIVSLTFGITGISQAVQVDATITADNYYAVYYGDETSVTYVGRNESGTVGNPGTYNWSLPESYAFDVTAGDYIYVAAWSDAAVAQAWLGQFNFDGQTLLTNDTDWEVYLTYDSPNYTNGASAPSAASVLSNIAEANTVGWGAIFETRTNGSNPWGTISDISTAADWIWGSGIQTQAVGEYQLFRTQVAPVPEPATFILLGGGLAGLAFYRRKRK